MEVARGYMPLLINDGDVDSVAKRHPYVRQTAIFITDTKSWKSSAAGKLTESASANLWPALKDVVCKRSGRALDVWGLTQRGTYQTICSTKGARTTSTSFSNSFAM